MSKKPTGPKDFKDKKSADSPHSLSRKSFLKTSALATASTFFFVPRHVLGGAGSPAPSAQLMLAAIGAARKGACAIRKSTVNGRGRVVALCDVVFSGSAMSTVEGFTGSAR